MKEMKRKDGKIKHERRGERKIRNNHDSSSTCS
jgi:hypothetical protein